MKKVKVNLKQIKTKSTSFKNEFKEFINRGNVMDLAVGIVIGSAFTAIVTSIVNDIIMPLVSLIGGGFNFTTLSITIPNFFGGESGATLTYGNFIQNTVNFLIIALVVFLMIKFINKFHKKADETIDKTSDEKTTLLKDILTELKKQK